MINKCKCLVLHVFNSVSVIFSKAKEKNMNALQHPVTDSQHSSVTETAKGLDTCIENNGETLECSICDMT